MSRGRPRKECPEGFHRHEGFDFVHRVEMKHRDSIEKIEKLPAKPTTVSPIILEVSKAPLLQESATFLVSTNRTIEEADLRELERFHPTKVAVHPTLQSSLPQFSFPVEYNAGILSFSAQIFGYENNLKLQKFIREKNNEASSKVLEIRKSRRDRKILEPMGTTDVQDPSEVPDRLRRVRRRSSGATNKPAKSKKKFQRAKRN